MSYLLAKLVKVLNHFSLIFQKTRIKDCFKFSILSILTYANSEKFLLLNGISIVFVINSLLKQYVINFTKLVHA